MSAIINNPYVVAAVIGVGVYYAIDTYKPGFLAGYEFATPMNLGIAAALLYLFYLYYLGKIRLPFLGRRYVPMPIAPLPAQPGAPAEAGMSARVKGVSSSINDLLGPDQF